MPVAPVPFPQRVRVHPHPRSFEEFVRAGMAQPVYPSVETGWRRSVSGREVLPGSTNLIVNPVFGANITDGWAAAPTGASGSRVTSLPAITTQQGVTVFEDFETNGDWTAAGGGTVGDDVTHFKTGTKSQKLTTTTAGTQTATKTINWDLSQWAGAFRLWVYIADITTVSSISLVLANDSGFSNVKTLTWYGYGYSGSPSYPANDNRFCPLQNGWNLLGSSKASMVAATGSGVFTSPWTRLRLSVTAMAATVANVSFDSFSTLAVPGGLNYNPCVMFDFDDGIEGGVYNEALPILREFGFVGNSYIVGSWVGTTNYMTAAEIQAVYAAGWDICNHSWEHVIPTTLTEAQLVTSYQTNANYIANTLGCPRGAYHLAYPYGQYSVDEVGDTRVTDAAAAIGALSGRAGTQQIQYWPPQSIYQLSLANMKSLNYNTVFSEIQPLIDEAQRTGGLCRIIAHNIQDSAGTNDTCVNTSVFKQIVSYVQQLGLPVMTISQWMKQPPVAPVVQPLIPQPATYAAQMTWDSSHSSVWESNVVTAAASHNYECQIRAMATLASGVPAPVQVQAVVLNSGSEVRRVTLGGSTPIEATGAGITALPGSAGGRHFIESNMQLLCANVNIAASGENQIKFRFTPSSYGQSLYVANAEIESNSYLDPFFCGISPGCAWSGSANNSTSTRTQSILGYTCGSWMGTSAGTVACCAYSNCGWGDAASRALLYVENAAVNGAGMMLYKSGSAGAFKFYPKNAGGTSVTATGPGWGAGAQAAAAFGPGDRTSHVGRWDASWVNLNDNGLDSTPMASGSLVASVSTLYIGTDYPAASDFMHGQVAMVIVSPVKKSDAWTAAIQANNGAAWSDPVRLFRDFLASGDLLIPLVSGSVGYLKTSGAAVLT